MRTRLPRKCTVCAHPDAVLINEALVIEGASNRAITRRFELSKDAIRRHREHIPQLLVQALKAEEAANADDLLDKLTGMMGRFERFLDEAERASDGAEFRAHAAEWRRHLETLAKIRGQLAQEGNINIHLSAEWIELRAVIVEALEPYAAARAAVMRALAQRNGGQVTSNGHE